jgi:RNA polymerase sigma factor (sigma-70 family)
MPTTWKLTHSADKLYRLSGELFRFFRKRVEQTVDAEDLTSETLIAGGRLFGRRSSPRFYLFVIARNQLADHYYRLKFPGLKSAAERDLSDTEIAEELVDSDDEWTLDRRIFDRYRFDQLQAALERVPADNRRALDLQLRGYNNFEIAARLGIKYHTARSRLARGKAHLMKFLAEVRSEP